MKNFLSEKTDYIHGLLNDLIFIHLPSSGILILILSMIISFFGLQVFIWYMYFTFSLNRLWNTPSSLQKIYGHILCWILIAIGSISLIVLHQLSITAFWIIVLSSVILKLIGIPLRMPYRDVMDILYSLPGLRLGGFRTSEFLEVTEELEEKMPGIREKIIAEAHYLILWLNRLPEIGFLLGLILFKSLSAALFLSFGMFVFEIMRYICNGASLFLALLCRLWNWLRWPVTLYTIVIFWSVDNTIFIILIIFLVFQIWLGLFVAVGLLPIRIYFSKFICATYGGNMHNIEGTTLNDVICKWRKKLL